MGDVVPQIRGIRMQPEDRDDEHHQGQTTHAEDVLQHVELQPPQRHPQREPGHRDPQQIVDAGGQLQRQPDAAGCVAGVPGG